MRVGKTVRRFGVTLGLVVGLAMAGLPAQAIDDPAPVGEASPPPGEVAPPVEASTTPSEVAPAAATACAVTEAQLLQAIIRANDAAGRNSAGAGIGANCRIVLHARESRIAEVASRIAGVSGLVPVMTGRPMPASTPGAIVVEIVPSGPVCLAIWPPAPCGWEFQQIVLSPSMAGSHQGEVLAVDDFGYLFRYSLVTGSRLSDYSNLGSGWSNIKVVAPGDWNGDGKADVIGVDKTGRMLLYPGNGQGRLGKSIQIGHGWSKLTVIPAGDLNGDKIPDMLAIDNRTGVLLLYLGNGKGGFQPGNRQVGHGWKTMQLFAAGDMNADGKIDILGLKPDGKLLFYAGKGTGTFRPAVQVGHGWTGMTLAAGADLDGDGRADIVGRTKNGDLLFYRGKGIGTFNKSVKIASWW